MIDIHKDGLTATFTQYGASLVALSHEQFKHSIVLGHKDEASYKPGANPAYMGSIVGRVANRIHGAECELAGSTYRLEANENGNTLHGGPKGWSHRAWSIVQQRSSEITFALESPNGDQGFPGNIRVEVNYELDAGALFVQIQARTDAATAFAPAFHPYFSLLGPTRGIGGHTLWVNSYAQTAVDDHMLTTGALDDLPAHSPDLRKPLDTNYCMFAERSKTLRNMATMTARNGLVLDICSTEAGLQVYNAHGFSRWSSVGMPRYAGLALEPQAWPGALKHAHFPSILLQPADQYRSYARYYLGRSFDPDRPLPMGKQAAMDL